MRVPFFSSFSEAIVKTVSGKRPDAARKPESISVIISTYNNPLWLEKVLWGYSSQDFDTIPYDIIIADDGSNAETEDLIRRFQADYPVPLHHVWHPDDGFQKCKILNKAIKASTSDFLVFTDQDCVPRNDFLASHYRYAEPGYYLSGGYLKLPRNVSHALTREDILSGRAFDPRWLKDAFSFSTWKIVPKLVDNPKLASLLNWLTTTSATCNGCCFSCWREDIVAVNGYNEMMRYGGLDRELGERMLNLGIKAKQLRYSLVCMHLDHDRPYETGESWENNARIRREIRRNKTVRTPFGIESAEGEKNLLPFDSTDSETTGLRKAS